MQTIAKPFRSRRRHTAQALAVTVLAGACIGLVSADDAVPYTKAETTALVTGKKVSYVRARDGATISWDFKGGDTVYYLTPNTQRNTSFSGTYAIEDDGSVCFKWNPDKNLTMVDGCIVFKRESAKTHVVGKRTNTVTGDLVE